MFEDAPDVCVVGSGPAGLAVALRCAARGQSVLLAESGNGGETGDLNDGDVVDASVAADRTDPLLVPGPLLFEPHYLSSGRIRAPGGCSSMWSVRARTGAPTTVRLTRPERVDFEAQPAFDIPAWPVPFDEIDTYLNEAGKFFGLPQLKTEPPDDAGSYSLDRRVFEPRYFQFARNTVIHEDRFRAAQAAENIQVRRGWTLRDIETNTSCSRIEHLTFADAAGQDVKVSPRHVVLACGGVENARILLNAVDDGQLVDPFDTIGRWFSDHPHARLGVFIPDADILDAGRFHDFHDRQGHPVLGHYALTPDATAANSVLRFSMTLVGAPASTATQAAAAGAKLADARHTRMSPIEVLRQIGRVAKEPGSTLAQLKFKLGRGDRHHTALGGWSDPATQVTNVSVLAVESMVGQRPSRDNRVRLGETHCRLGKRRARLQWSWSQPEIDSYWRSVELARDHFNSLDVGKYLDAADLGSGRIPRAGTGWHQMGGTRMSSEPATGVVNADCRHHQTENLYMAGSSIFASSIGYANPTLTLVAFALRLGDHLL